MNLPANRLNDFLKNNHSPIYLLAGEEVVLVKETLSIIDKHFKEKGFVNLSLWADKDFLWSDLVNLTSSLSLFNEKTLITLNILSDKLAKEAHDALLFYSQNIPSDKVLVIVMNKLGQSKKTKWFESILKTGVVIQIWSLKENQLVSWVSKRMESKGLRFDKECAAVLAQYSKGNLLYAADEIEKLSLLHGLEHISQEKILDSIFDNSKADIFGFIKTLFDKKVLDSIKMLGNLKENMDPILMLWLLVRELRKRYSGNFLVKTIKQSAKIDQIIKGVQEGDVWEEFENLCLLFN